MPYTVDIEQTFRGPLDLLLYLVKRDEIDLHDIPIAHLTREYLAQLNRLQELDVDLGGDFIAMASMLMEIKGRMLLPPAAGEDDEDEDDFDPRAGLVEALLEYKRFKEAASRLGELRAEHACRVSRLAPLPQAQQDAGTIEETGVMDLFAAFNRMVRDMLASDAVEIVSDEVPTEVRLRQLRAAVRATGGTRFSLLLSSAPTRAEMVGFFIALLELVRTGEVRARQARDFDDIVIEARIQGKTPPKPSVARRLWYGGAMRFPPPVVARRRGSDRVGFGARGAGIAFLRLRRGAPAAMPVAARGRRRKFP